jgi:hypothetical protein
MAKEKIPFIQSEAPDNRFPINLFFLPKSFNGRDAMIGTPGFVARVESLIEEEVRGMRTDKNKDVLYVVAGNKLYLVDKTWTATAATSTLDSLVGPVFMESNLTQTMITDGSTGYIVTKVGTTPTLTKIVDPDFVSPSSLTLQDSYFIVSKKNSFYYQISELNNGLEWNAVDLGTAEGNSDDIFCIISDHRQLFLFKNKSGEVAYNDGVSTFPFVRYPDVYIEGGIGAASSVVKADNSLFYLDNDFIVRRLDGFTPKIVSPPQLNQVLSLLTTKSDAKCYSYERQGNIFYVMIFPTENKTYVLNIATGFVHQWASGIDLDRHRSNCYESFNGKDLVGDYSNGKIYSLEDSVYTDDELPIKWIYTSPIYHSNGLVLFHKELQINFAVGVGNVTDPGEDPDVMLRFSDDGMHTWSTELWKKLGKIGNYKNIVRWSRLGSSRLRTYELSGTAPVKRMFAEVNLDIEVGNG